jgi:hypothetical protein
MLRVVFSMFRVCFHDAPGRYLDVPGRPKPMLRVLIFTREREGLVFVLWLFMGVHMVNVLARYSPDHAQSPQPDRRGRRVQENLQLSTSSEGKSRSS